MGVADPNGLERPLKQQPGRGSESQDDRLTRGPAWGKRRREKDQGDDGFECAKSFDHCRHTVRALLRPKRKACWRPRQTSLIFAPMLSRLAIKAQLQRPPGTKA